MSQRTPLFKVLATVLVFSIQALVIPVSADTSATLGGAVVSSSDQAPLEGVRVHAGDPATGKIYTSSPSTPDGSFTIEGLPASTYDLAIESDGGLYLVGTPVQVAPGQSRAVNVSINGQMAPSPTSAKAAKTSGGIWNNPLTAALVVLGSAVVLGVIIEAATDDDDETNASPTGS